MKNKTILLTGGTGFIGSNLALRLITEGWDVHLIIRPNSNLTPIQKIKDNIQLHLHNGTYENMAEIIESVKPLVVIHLASLFIAQHSSQDIDNLIESNITFGTQLLEAMVKSNINYLINTGTSWQHFENKDYSPVCLYAATKQAFEDILQFYTETTDLKQITLKLFDTYGPNDPRPKLFTLLNKVAMEQQPLAMSAGEQLIDIVYIDDVIEAFIVGLNLLLEDKITINTSYAISSGKPIPLKELVQIYSTIIGKYLPIEWGKRPYRPREVMLPWNKGPALPNWKAQVNLEAGIKKLITTKN